MESKKLRMFKNEQEVLDNMAECDRQERLQGLDPYSPEAEVALATWRPAGATYEDGGDNVDLDDTVKRGAIDVCVALGYENPAQTVADHVDGDDLSKRYAIDVCVALGYTNPSKAVADHVDDKDLTKRYALAAGGRVQQTTSAVARLYSQQRMDI